jgi:hypothetical protein
MTTHCCNFNYQYQKASLGVILHMYSYVLAWCAPKTEVCFLVSPIASVLRQHEILFHFLGKSELL